LSVQLYNSNGTERIVIENDTLYLDNTFGIEYHRMLEDIVGHKLNLIYTDHNPVCEVCGSENLSKHDKPGRNINKNHFIQVRSYKCKCGKINQTSLDLFIEKVVIILKRLKILVFM
jgi:tRNA(Ile2) C34 agmatinyltransferase TiaS